MQILKQYSIFYQHIGHYISDMKKLNYGKLVKKLRSDKDQITFLQEKGIFPMTMECSGCHETLHEIHEKKKYFFFNCKKCKKKISLRHKTILSNSNILLRKLILLVYIFVGNFWTYNQIQVVLDVNMFSIL